MFHKHSGIPVPKDRSRIIVLENNLTDVGSLALERRMIVWYGRKDIGTGILHNRTDGGDGGEGYKHTKESLDKMSSLKLGPDNPNFGKETSIETKDRIRKSTLGEKNHQYGKEHSEEVKSRISASLTGKKQSEETKQKRAEALKLFWQKKRLANAEGSFL